MCLRLVQAAAFGRQSAVAAAEPEVAVVVGIVIAAVPATEVGAAGIAAAAGAVGTAVVVEVGIEARVPLSRVEV